MSEKRFTTKNIICSNYCVWDNNDKPYGNDDVVVLLNEQQSTISQLKAEKDKLRELIKEKVFGRYVEGSLADLEFKAIAYDDIVKLEIFNESEPKVVVICRQGKKENVRSFCQMFIPLGWYYEIKEINE